MRVPLSLIRRSALLIMLLVGLAAALPIAGAAAPGGNSDNAKLCQKGGWMTLATSEDPYTAFADQGTCVSYGAQGGQIVDVIVYAPIVTAVTVQAGPYHCQARVSGTGFLPNTTYSYNTYWFGSLFTSGETVTTDANGSFVFNAWSYVNGAGIQYQAQIGDTYSNVVTLNC